MVEKTERMTNKDPGLNNDISMNNSTKITRRTMIKTIGFAGLAPSSITSIATAQSAEKYLPKGLVKKAAEKQVLAASQQPQFTEWNGASVGRPTTYYRKNAGKGPAYLRSAYVFPVIDGSNSVGYITTSARQTEGPIIEYSTAQPPNEYLARARDTGAKRGKTEEVPLYHGGLKYGLAFEDGTAMNVMNGRPQPIGDGIAPDALATNTAPTQWDTIQTTPQTTDNGLAPNSAGDDVSTRSHKDSIENYVPYVPAWTETDSGGGNYTRYGDGKDAWAKWDGCVPIAASMLIASHEDWPRPENDWARERMIDRLHRDMNTSHGGWTKHSDAVDGIRQYDYGDHNYYPNNVGGYFDRAWVRNEVIHNRPTLLGADGGKFDDHMVTVVGYSNWAHTLRVHNTWDWSPHNFSWGNWNSATMIKVEWS